MTTMTAQVPREVKSGPKRKIQCGRNSASSSSSWLRNFLGSIEVQRTGGGSTTRATTGRCRSVATVPYSEVEPDEVKARIARGEDVFLLDVREPDEVEAWAYPIGINIPLGQLGDRLEEIPRERTIVVACHVGGRSAAAAQALERRRLDGGEPDRRRRGLGGRRRSDAGLTNALEVPSGPRLFKLFEFGGAPSAGRSGHDRDDTQDPGSQERGDDATSQAEKPTPRESKDSELPEVSQLSAERNS